MIGIIGAMDSEVNLLCEKLKNKKESTFGSFTFFQGKLEGKKVVIVKCGIGKVNAALCTQLLIIQFKVKKIINTGIAGAVGGNLKTFDFVVSTSTVYHDFDTTYFGYKKGQIPGMPEQFIADKKMISITISSFNKTDFSKSHQIKEGLIASGDQFISEKTKKDYIKSSFSPLCVEMEGCAVSHTCYAYGIPFIIVRCMSDMADETVESTYSFNEDICAKASATLVKEIIQEL